MASEVTASLSPINPNTLLFDGYELADQSIIPNENIISSFTPQKDKVELWIYDFNKNLISGDTDFKDYSLVQSPSENDENDNEILELSPIEDLTNLGFDTGQLYTVYNFIRYQLSSSVDNLYYLSEISSDRTEIRLKSNIISNVDIASSFSQLKSELDSSEYFDEFYINFGDNELHIGVNILLDTNDSQSSVLIKLYDALPPQYVVKDTLSVVTKVAESVGYSVEYPNIIDIPSDVTFLQGPNTNLEIKDFVNNSTELKSKSELLSTNSTASKDNLQNVLNQKGVKITPNYSYNTFNEFVNFSSAKRRIENFIEKVEQIQAYEADIDTLSSITGPTSESYSVSSSIASAETNIENLIKNFDGYEYYLYYNTSSLSYPKTGSSFPLTLLPTTDVSVSVWLGSDIENSQYYGGILLSASLYDNNNQNWLYYTIPEFIRDNSDNNQYLEFSNMVGQHFDEIWLYTKAVSEKNNTTSDLDEGIPLQLADDAISSLGYKGFGNNYNNQDNFIGLTGEDNGSYVPPTGSEWITDYIAVNGGNVANYWVIDYSYDNYVEQINDPGYPYAIDRVSKEIFKRLYHNMSYLVKKKGTISGLRQLINIWGIPNTILRINEFGGKNKDNSDDYDLWYNRYSYAFTPVSTQNLASASVVFPWMPLERNRIVDSEYIVPDSLQFRFKTTGYPSSSYVGEFFTQSLAVKKSDGDDTSTDFDFGIALFYTGSTSGSYSGSYTNEYNDWGLMRFYMSGSSADGGVAVSNDIYLPFYNKGWWSVMLQRDTHVSASDNSNSTTYTLYVKNKTYNGWDGNSIGFEGSASIVSNVSTSINEAWNKFGTGSADGVYLGGFVSGSNVGGVVLNENGKIFSGSLQEFRYYSVDLSESIFNDFVMNPESIEGVNLTGSLSSFDVLNFRAPLGNEMESIFTASYSSSYSESMVSMHPAITGAADLLITGSFVNPSGNVTSSTYDILYYENTTTKTYSKTNTEVYFLDQPAIGIRNRISNKIEIDNAQDYGTTLSSLRSIQQDYQISRSYTEDINNLEVAFSPQDEVNDDIIQTFGFGVVADALADPRFVSSSDDYYPKLRRTAEDYFQKYTKGNVYDYLRLIKYFDNSIFKAIKNYVPARTSVSTGIVIKQHMLERNRAKPVQLSEVTTLARYASGSVDNISWNQPLDYENLELTSSLSISNITGSTGGSVNKFNYSGSPNFEQLPITQSWDNNIPTELGLTTIIENKEREFYDGEYSGSTIVATTQSLFFNPYLISQSVATIGDINYSSSDYNPLFNNVLNSRTSSYVMKLEYDSGSFSPSNLGAVLSGSAKKAQTPDSNYTSKRSIIPRYSGSKVYSANYNTYTPSSSSIKFANNTTGSWGGDSSYGKTAAIDKNPIYFAHFKTSQVDYSIFGNIQFTIDSLIESPFEDIRGKDFVPKTFIIDGDNKYLSEVISSFEKNRKTSVAYMSTEFNGVNYKSLSTGNFNIYRPGLEYIVTFTNQISETNVTLTSSFNRFEIDNKLEYRTTSSVLMVSHSGYFELKGTFPLSGPNQADPIYTIWFTNDNINFNNISQSDFMGYVGPDLSVIHTYNYSLKNNIYYDNSSPLFISRPYGVVRGINPNFKFNYFRFNPSESEVPQYLNLEEPFLIERGDEIRVTYETFGANSGSILNTKDFIVTEISTSYYGAGDPNNSYTWFSSSVLLSPSTKTTGSEAVELWNAIKVWPDPDTISPPIPNGEIRAFTVRKRQQADDKIIIESNPPSGSNGAVTPSGEGYLVPNDMTEIQKRNVRNIINQLKGKNAFRNDDTNAT